MNENQVFSDSRREPLATRALRASEAQYHDLCENVTEIVFTLNSTGDFTSMNRAGEKAGGYSREEVLGMNFADIVAAEYAREARTLLAWQPQYPPAFQAMEIMTKDGNRLPLLLRLSTIVEQGTPAVVQAIACAPTQLVEIDEKSRQSEKMDVMGRMDSGITHDFNNVLTAILGYGYLALEKLEAESAAYREVSEMIRATQRAATLTDQMRGLTRRETPEEKVLNLNDAVTGIEQMLRRVIKEEIEIVTRLEADLDSVLADQSTEPAILNLVLNARDAMPQGGTLMIETSSVYLESLAVASNPGLAPGRYAKLKVSITGCGMNAESLSPALDPFFTTENRGKGLGLPSTFATVKETSGRIAACSEPQTFEIYLPTILCFAQDSLPDRSLHKVQPACKTVLVIDDEELIRSTVHANLRKSGYSVLEAASGAEAAQIAEHHGAPIDLLLTDVVMPQMSGPESAARLLVSHPEMKVLYMTGHSRDTIAAYGIGESETALLQKPFTPDSLELKVRALLASSADPARKRAAGRSG